MNRADDQTTESGDDNQRALSESSSRRASRRRLLRSVGQQLALILVALILLGACMVVLLIAFFVGRMEVVSRSTQPDGKLVVQVELRSSWGSNCWSIHARTAGAWRWRKVGPTWCEHNHAYLPFQGEQLRFSWYPEQGIVTTVESLPDKPIETWRFLSAYHYSPDGRTIERIPLIEEKTPGELTLEPIRAIEGDWSRVLDANDAKIRNILALPTRVPPTPWPR